LLVGAVYVLIVTQHSGQIDALFDTLVFPADHGLIVAIAVLTGVILVVLMPRPIRSLRVVDLVICMLPAASLVARFYLTGSINVAAAIGVILIAAVAVFFASRRSFGGWRPVLVTAVLTIACWFGLRHALLVSPVAFPRQLGAVAIVLLFAGFAAVTLQLAFRSLAVSLVLAAASGYALFAYQEKHLITLNEQTDHDDSDGNYERNIRWQVSVQQTFRTWLKSRNDLEAFLVAGKPYPVFIAASEGGGGYAAAHADLFLTKLQQRCPNFAQHLFVMVGVSGGSVGNTLFQTALKDEINPADFKGCGGRPEPGQVLEQLGTDHLSPVLAALLFQDFPNKLLFGLLGTFDRSEALAASLSTSAWREKADVERLYWNHFWRSDVEQPAFGMGEGPALVYVATNAVSGKRYVFAPFSFPYNSYRARFEEYLSDMNWTGPDESGARQSDVRLIDGVVASASFPWLTPSRVLEARLGETVSLVDGGYLENSGAETARDIIDALTSRESDPNMSEVENMLPPRSYVGSDRFDACETIEVVYSSPPGSLAAPEAPDLDAMPKPCSITFSIHFIAIRAEVPYQRSAQQQDFLLDPVTALLSSRSRRAETARFGLLSQLCGGLECPEADTVSTWRYYESVIATDYLTLPLGWYLPKAMLGRLEPFVAPDPSVEFDLADLPDGGMAAIVAAQLRSFGTMKDNPWNMKAIENALDPGH